MKLELKRNEIPHHLLKYFRPVGFKPKDEIDIPNMVCEALRRDGWYRRSTIIWHKPNPMPESCTDRPTKSHEYIFLLSKAATYYYDSDAVAEPASMDSGFAKQRLKGVANWAHREGIDTNGGNQGNNKVWTDTATRNRRSVWTVATKPYIGAHFATFPPDLIEPCILAGTSAHGCCAACGAPWARVVERTPAVAKDERGTDGHSAARSVNGNADRNLHNGADWYKNANRVVDLGWQPTCTCNADVVPCTVLDPFAGSGTTLAVALKHGRRGLGIELNADYIELAHTRIRQSQPMLLDVTA